MKYRLNKSIFLPILMALVISSCNSRKEAVYLLPDGYKGPIIILFQQPDGVTLPVENGFNVYRIPENGILKVKSKPILRVINEKFYYEKSNGERIPIVYLQPTETAKPRIDNSTTFDQIKTDETTTYVFGRETGKFSRAMSKTARYRAFKIGKVSDVEDLNEQTRQKMNDLSF